MIDLQATLTHDHQHGTLLEIRDLRPHPETRTAVKAAGFRWSRSIGWYRPRSRDTNITNSQLKHIVALLTSAGVDVDTTIDNNRRNIEDKLSGRAKRSTVRAEHLDEVAAGKSTTAGPTLRRALELASLIPMGQPILAVHHSAPAHIRHIAKIRNEMDEATNATGKSKAIGRRGDVARRTASRIGDPTFLVNRILEAERNNDQKTVEEILGLLARKGVRFVDPRSIEAGQRWFVRGTWIQVVKVNTKTVTVRAIYPDGSLIFPESITNRIDLRYFHQTDTPVT